ncbi:hypothetical protein P7L64_26595 [Tistrella bauzanensis]|nr:hypothetical protein [Tistrella bauzanensis]
MNSKSIEPPLGAQPDILVGPGLDIDPEAVGEAGAELAVDAVGGHDQVEPGEGVEIGVEFGFERHPHAQLPGAVLQNRQQALAADADEAMAGRADRLAAEPHHDILPRRETADDRLGADRVVGPQIVHRLIREHHAPAEGVAGTVALDDLDVVGRVAQLHRYREIEAGRPAAEACNAHLAPVLARVREAEIILSLNYIIAPPIDVKGALRRISAMPSPCHRWFLTTWLTYSAGIAVRPFPRLTDYNLGLKYITGKTRE